VGRGAAGARRAAQRKLLHELGIASHEVPLDAFHFLTRIHYRAPSDDVWGEHESTCPDLFTALTPMRTCARLFYVGVWVWLWASPPTYVLAEVLRGCGGVGAGTVDYILFIHAKVTVRANANEVADWCYVSQEQLRALLTAAESPAAPLRITPWFRLIAHTHLFAWWDALRAGKTLPTDPAIQRML
jgi:isopentenyl-diphosphate Delta-isomerase